MKSFEFYRENNKNKLMALDKKYSGIFYSSILEITSSDFLNIPKCLTNKT